MTILTIFDQTIIQKSYTKFLGLFIDDKLTWKPHATKYVLSKISRIVGILGKLNSLLTSSSMKTIYYSLVYPHILYGVIFWKAVSKAEFNKIFCYPGENYWSYYHDLIDWIMVNIKNLNLNSYKHFSTRGC